MMVLDDVFEGARVPRWLRQFADQPETALEDLLLDRAELGPLNAADPITVLLDWLNGVGDRGGFAESVDEALARWIDDAWGRPALLNGFGGTTLTAIAWCRASNLIGMEPRLLTAAERLGERVLGDQAFLAGLAEGRSRDPQGRAWLAIARRQTDRRWLNQWWLMCSLPPNQPWYWGEYGVAGLLHLPAAENVRQGTFREELGQGLVQLALAFGRWARENWLDEKLARNEFVRTAALTMVQLPFPEKWIGFWRDALEHPDQEQRPPEDWVRSLPLMSDITKSAKSKGGSVRRLPEPDWAHRSKMIATRLTHREWDALKDAQRLLDDQIAYADATGDVYYAVRTACNLANRLREDKPEVAARWLADARRLDPWNPYAWTSTSALLLAEHRLAEALSFAVQAIQRFPENVVAHTGLAEVLKAQDRLHEAEALYRDTIHRFPDNEVAYTGLAEVLKAQDRLPEAEALYRDTIRRVRNNEVAYNGLAEVLKAQGRFHEAEAVYRDVLRRWPNDPYARTGLKRLEEYGTGADGRAAQQISEYAEPADEPRPDDVATILCDAYLLRRWGRQLQEISPETHAARRAEARRLLQPFVDLNAKAATETALLLLNDGDLDQAIGLLREAARQFRNHSRITYALMRALREQAGRQSRRLDEQARREMIRPWAQLRQQDSRLAPLHWLGEGRSWLALSDGAELEGHAVDAFGRLAHWVQKAASTSEDATTGANRPELSFEAPPLEAKPSRSLTLSEWWADEVRAYVFGGEPVAKAEDIRDLEGLRQRVRQNSVILDSLEEEYLDSFTVT